MKLQNNNDRGCLGKNLQMTPCTAGTSVTEWTFVFNGGEIFTIHEGKMKCLTRDAGSVSLKTCNSRDDGLSLRQSWSYFGSNGTFAIPDDDGEKCLVFEENIVNVGFCNSTGATWSRYSECSLNTRNSTKPMVLESFDRPGMCIARETFNTLVSCEESSSIGQWVYHYDTSKSRLQRVNGQAGFCLGRNDPTADEETSPSLVDSPTGLVDCSDLSSSDVIARWLHAPPGGEEANIFQWQDPLADKLYCMDVPQSSQTECKSDYSDAARWRKYGSSGDGLVVSVKPSLLRQSIDDPEVLKQFFLLSAEGTELRKLRAKGAGLYRDVERVLPLISRTEKIITRSTDLIDSVTTPIDNLNSRLNSFETFFRTIALVLR